MDEDEVEYAYQKLNRSWSRQKLRRTSNSLFKAIILAYKRKKFTEFQPTETFLLNADLFTI